MDVSSLHILSLGVKRVTYFPLGGHSRPEALSELIFDVVISCAQLQPNWGPSLSPGLSLQHSGVR